MLGKLRRQQVQHRRKRRLEWPVSDELHAHQRRKCAICQAVAVFQKALRRIRRRWNPSTIVINDSSGLADGPLQNGA